MAVSSLPNVLGTVNNPQVPTTFLNESSVTRRNPALSILCVCCAFCVLVVFNKNARATIKDFTVFSDPQLHTWARYANGIRTHLTIRLRSDKHRRFGLAI